MNQRALRALGLLSLAATVLVAVAFVAHATPINTPSTAPTSDSDAGTPCSGSDSASQMGDCDSQVGDMNDSQVGDQSGADMQNGDIED